MLFTVPIKATLLSHKSEYSVLLVSREQEFSVTVVLLFGLKQCQLLVISLVISMVIIILGSTDLHAVIRRKKKRKIVIFRILGMKSIPFNDCFNLFLLFFDIFFIGFFFNFCCIFDTFVLL